MPIRDIKRVVTLNSALYDCSQFEESMKILDKAVEDIAALGYNCTVENYINDTKVVVKTGD